MSGSSNFIDFVDEFFDIHNVEHMAAYKVLNHTGAWPEGFVPENCEFSSTWLATINAKMANAYVRYGLRGQIYGMPSIDQ